MQVAHQNTHVTHAVIGGMEAIEMTTSSSAEFIHIMASSIYKDQKLAVIREVMCNAWDAHIESGITDKPIEITLTHEKLIIRDFGSGIHHDDMGPVYGVFGNSTKKNDGKQTGGFGLGCKAPYAYVDHFEVISMHDGIRTVYNLSKSSAQAMGKPAIVPIVSFPSPETGLQVTIDVLNRADYDRFNVLIQRIARNGDMNVMYNGKPVNKLEMPNTKGAYLITKDNSLLDISVPIMIRYGNVIYPVELSNDITMQYDKVKNHLLKLRNSNEEYRIIFQAPPHSIAVQPSREGLSMQSHTVNTLKMLMDDFISQLNTDFLVECESVAKTTTDEAVSTVRISALLNTTEKLPFRNQTFAPHRIEDLSTMARRYMEVNYPQTLDFRKRDLSYRVKAMSIGGLIDRGLAQTFIRDIKNVKTRFIFNQERTDWLHRQVIGPVATKMQGTSLKLDRLYVYDPEDQNAPRSAYNRELIPLIHAVRARPKHLFMTLPYLRNIVVLATAKTNLWERTKRHDTFRELGQNPGFLFYHVGMKKADKEEAITFFKATRMVVVDLTERQDWEASAPSSKLQVAAPRKPKKVGLPCLTGMLTKNHVDVTDQLKDDVKRITEPEFIVMASTAHGEPRHRIGRFDETATRFIIELFGDKGAITNNSAIHAKALGKGAVKAEKYINDKVCNFIMNNPNIQEYWAYHPERAITKANMGYYAPTDLIRVLYRSATLRVEFGLINNLTDEEYKYIIIWNDLLKQAGHYRGNMSDEMRATEKYLDAIPLHKANFDLIERVNSSNMIKIIDRNNLKTLVDEYPSSSPEQQMAIKILGLALSI